MTEQLIPTAYASRSDALCAVLNAALSGAPSDTVDVVGALLVLDVDAGEIEDVLDEIKIVDPAETTTNGTENSP